MPGADDKTGDGEAFLARWARRKEAQRQAAPAADREPAEADGPGEAAPSEAAEPPLRVEDLPDIDSLDEGSDFTVFLKEGVPQSLRRRALRKLFRLNPIFANLDGLAEYDEDYHTVVDLPGGVKTLFQAGKGMAQPESEDRPDATETAEDSAAPEEPQADAAQAATETDGPAALPEESAEPLPEDPAPDRKAAAAVETASSTEAPAARGSAVKRRWGGFES